MDKIAVLDFGGQYAHLIANRIRRLGVYSEIFDGDVEAFKLKNFKGLILSGGPDSVSRVGSIKCDAKIFELGIPILGICYGHQLIGVTLGGDVKKGRVREYGHAKITFKKNEGIFKGIKKSENVWMSHFDQVYKMPKGFILCGFSNDCKIAAMADFKKNIYGIQFHPEVTHTPCGMKILENFVKITKAKKQWNIENYIEFIKKEIKEKVKNKKVFMLVSGGVDSTVAFALLEKALGKEKVYGLFVDTGFMRKNEREEVVKGLQLAGVKNLNVKDASKEYFEALKGVYEPEQKRKIIGDLFLTIKDQVSSELKLNPNEWIMGQGTIYPDTIETGGTKHADKIKTHHNRIDKIQELIKQGKVIEPICQLYKDEVRILGKKLKLADHLVSRHPFPGPGLAVRCLCAKSEDYPENYLAVEKSINNIVKKSGLKAKILPIKSVGVQGDERTYRHPVCIYGKVKNWETLSKISTQLTNKFPEINRVILGLNMPEKINMTIQNGYLTKARIDVLSEADDIVMNHIRKEKLLKDIWQFPTVLIPVSIDGGKKESVVLRPVCSEEAMTANFYRMNFKKLESLYKKLIATKHLSGVFYDITNKPPATIEWE